MQPGQSVGGLPPQVYIINPPIKAMNVPVLLNPGLGDVVIDYLKSGTPIKVLQHSDVWLLIEMPENKRGLKQGFVRTTQARLATVSEIEALLIAAPLSTGQQKVPFRQDSVLQATRAGVTGGRQERGRYGLTRGLIGGGVLCGVVALTIATTLGGQCNSQGFNPCQSISMTNSGWAGVGGLIMLLAALLVALGIGAAIIEFVRVHSSR